MGEDGPVDSRRGFTLVELVIVMVVVGILAAIAIPRYTEMQTRALQSMLVSDLKSVTASQELHRHRNLTYGTTPTEIDAVTSEDVTISIEEATSTGWSATATHPGVGSGTCAVYYGSASPIAPATRPGVVTCDFWPPNSNQNPWGRFISSLGGEPE